MDVMNQLPFFFIHGAGGTKDKWRNIQRQLGDVSAHFVDLPGRGNNPEVNAATVIEYADIMHELIPKETIIVGHSMGGLIGIELAARNRNVKGLVLVNSHFSLPVHAKVLRALKEGIFPDGLFYASYSKEVSFQLLEEEKADVGRVPAERTYIDFKACNDYTRGREVFAELNIPVLSIYGEEDRMLPLHASCELLASNSNVRVEVIEQSGHYTMLEQPDKLVHELMMFREALMC